MIQSIQDHPSNMTNASTAVIATQLHANDVKPPIQANKNDNSHLESHEEEDDHCEEENSTDEPMSFSFKSMRRVDEVESDQETDHQTANTAHNAVKETGATSSSVTPAIATAAATETVSNAALTDEKKQDLGPKKFEICTVCKNLIKTNKSGSYRSDNFLADYKAVFPSFDMSCGPVCYTCYYQCYQFRKKRRPAYNEDITSPRKRKANEDVEAKPRGRKKRKIEGAGEYEDSDDDYKSGKKKPNRKVNSNLIQQRKENSKVLNTNDHSALKEFDCVCCGRHETNGSAYSYKSLADVYQLLFPATRSIITDEGDVCKYCYNTGYKFRAWQKANPNADPAMFLSGSYTAKAGDNVFLEEDIEHADKCHHLSSASDISVNTHPSVLKRRTFVKRRSDEEDEDMEESASKAFFQVSKKASEYVERYGDNMVEAFFDIRVKDNEHDASYQKRKIIREFIPSKSSRNDLIILVQHYIDLIFSNPNSGETQATSKIADMPMQRKILTEEQEKQISEAIATTQPTSSSTSATIDPEGPTKEGQQSATTANTLPSGPRYIVNSIKLSEKDSSGVDLEIDLVTDGCFVSHPIKSKSRFIAYADLE